MAKCNGPKMGTPSAACGHRIKPGRQSPFTEESINGPCLSVPSLWGTPSDFTAAAATLVPGGESLEARGL